MKEYKLNVAQQGMACAKAFVIEKHPINFQTEDFKTEITDTAKETEKLEKAISLLKEELQSGKSVKSEQNNSIVETEIMLLEDENFTGKAKSIIQNEKQNAAYAVKKTGIELAVSFKANESEYIRERSDDVKGLTENLIRILSGKEKPALTEPSIIVAQELSPVEIACYDESLILGLVTEQGSALSHVSIQAGNLDIPYVFGNSEAVKSIKNGDCIIINNDTLKTEPSADEWKKALDCYVEAQKKKEEALKNICDETTRTKILANISSINEAKSLAGTGAQGIGLLRSEFLFLGKQSAPSEEEQFEAYKEAALAMGTKETVIRTMDIGSDKNPEWMKMPLEKNPALGLRGVRVSLGSRDLFKTQLKAIMRAAVFGNIKIMVPMIASVWELDEVHSLINECAKELSSKEIEFVQPSLGTMIETPAAVMIADDLAKKADFFSIGTNDLTQYALALDREAKGLNEYYDPLHESVFKLIEMTVAAAHKNSIPVCVCGEIASSQSAVKRLVSIGVDELSVSVSKIARTKLLAVEAEKKAGSLGSPADGCVVPMNEIPDEAFSSGALGKCIGVLPENGSIYAPVSGKVCGIAATKHALSIKKEDGSEILIHAGLDTVTLKGKGFTVLVKEGETVTSGQKIMQMDLDVIKKAGLSPMIVCVQTE